MFGWKVIDPSAHIGGGYTFLGEASYGTVNGGLGLTFWFTENGRFVTYNQLTNIHLTTNQEFQNKMFLLTCNTLQV